MGKAIGADTPALVSDQIAVLKEMNKKILGSFPDEIECIRNCEKTMVRFYRLTFIRDSIDDMNDIMYKLGLTKVGKEKAEMAKEASALGQQYKGSANPEVQFGNPDCTCKLLKSCLVTSQKFRQYCFFPHIFSKWKKINDSVKSWVSNYHLSSLS